MPSALKTKYFYIWILKPLILTYCYFYWFVFDPGDWHGCNWSAVYSAWKLKLPPRTFHLHRGDWKVRSHFSWFKSRDDGYFFVNEIQKQTRCTLKSWTSASTCGLQMKEKRPLLQHIKLPQTLISSLYSCIKLLKKKPLWIVYKWVATLSCRVLHCKIHPIFMCHQYWY